MFDVSEQKRAAFDIKRTGRWTVSKKRKTKGEKE
jgi:hypothetical protein